MTCTRAFQAGLIGSFLIASVSTVSGQQAATAQRALIRFPFGLQFEVPQGWSWDKLVHNSAGDSVELSYDATRPRDTSRADPNTLSVVLNPKAVATETAEEAATWTRVDINQSRNLPNGAAVRWKVGRKWNAHESLLAVATIGSRTLGFAHIGGQTRTFDPALLESAILQIAGSMREVPPSNAIFHPVWRFAVEEASKNWWINTVSPVSIGFQCAICGKENVFLNIYPVELNKTPPNLDAAFANVVGAVAKNGHKPGETREAALPGGQIRWTEQPGANWLFSGVVQREGRLLFMSLVGQVPPSITMDTLRADYLAIAKTVRPWNGR